MMTVVITLLSIPIGLILIYFEYKARPRYQAIFDDFFDEVRSDGRLHKRQKMQKVRDMLHLNAYEITAIDEQSITAKKKLFSMGWLTLSVGFAYIGAMIYILYFFFFHKPHTVKFTL